MMRVMLTLMMLLTAYSANALTIRFDPGGSGPAYEAKYRALVKRGDSIKIDGRCISACTMFLKLVPAHRVCVTSRASLGVHMASWPTPYGWRPNAQLTRHMVNRYYPGWVKTWIAQHGGLAPAPKYIPVSVLRSHYRSC